MLININKLMRFQNHSLIQ